MNKRDAHILVAEDEPNLQFLVQKQLLVLGYNAPDIAKNGLIAVEKALAKRYNIIFMDVMMPELDGLLATDRIRRSESLAGLHTPIVGMTAFAHRNKCLDSGMDGFLQKPVMLEQMEEALNALLKPFPGGEQATVLLPLRKAAVDETKFKQTDEKLENVQKRIADLRKRFGLN